MKSGVVATLGAASVILAACNVGPDYHEPAISVPPRFAEPHVPAAPAQADITKWWTTFQDAELNSLIARALSANLDLMSSASRVRQAREQVIVAGATEWPSVNVSGIGANLHSDSSPLGALAGGGASTGGGASGSGSGGASASGPTNIRLYALGLDASWQIDIFGGTRRAVEAAQANADAALWDLHDGEVTITSEIADDYVVLRAAQARIAQLNSELKDELQLFGLVRDRANAGFVTQLDVNQQKSIVETVRAQIPELQTQADAMIHAIAVLLAQPPESLAQELSATAPIPVAPPGLPATLPADLLRQRPDIREAERKLAAATANEGVAIADLYPKLDLLGAATFASNGVGNLLSTRNFNTLGAGSIIWPVFAGGQIRANIRASKEAELQAYLAWQKSVLAALQDVEDALARYDNEQRHEQALADSERAAESSETISRQQYVAGLVTFVNVLSAETTLLSARDQLIQSRAALSEDLATIYKALGGGWNETAVDWKTRPQDPENK
ncbi:MAG TPA: efflux transporter outer membrane subunit [Rhizomicrobium sp.]|jgi:NodT family efflux transporter outer membrane factor (OMF) lipoprotein